MKKRHLFLYIILFLFLAFITSFLWSLYTARGTSFLLKGITRALSGTVEIRQVTGRIGYSLHVEGLKLNLTDLTVTVDTANLKWQPLYLLTGKLAIMNLDVRKVSIIDRKPPEDKPVDLSLPKVPKWLTAMQGWVNDLSITGLKYSTPGNKPAGIDNFSAKIIWHRGVLYINEVNAGMDHGTVKGAVAFDLAGPALLTTLEVKLKQAGGGIDTISMDARLPASKGTEQIAGPVMLKARAGERERFSLECRLALARHSITISQARLSKKEGQGTIEAKGVLDFSGKKPAFSFSAGITGLTLAPEVPMDTNISGNVDIAGTVDDFKGRFRLVNPGASWKRIELEGDIHGGSERIELKGLEAKVLGGTILGHVSASFAKDMTVSARLSGQGLDPAGLRPDLEGNLNFELKGRIRIPENGPMEGSVTAALRKSRFLNRAISADLDASIGNKTIKINMLAARGNGFAVKASGTVSQRLSCDVRIDDASKLLPGATGSLLAGGWVRWRNNEPAGAVSAQGKGLSYGGTGTASFSMSVKMPEGYKGHIDAGLKARNVSHGILLLNTINIEVKGKVSDHGITLSAVYGNKDRADIQAQGKYVDGAWQGTILKASGKEALFGRWDLAGPSTVHVSKKRVALSSLALRSAAGESIDMNADIVLEPMAGHAGLTWRRVNLARAGRLTSPLELEGSTSGTSRVQWLKGKRLVLSGQVDAFGALSRGPAKVRIKNVNGRFNWDGSGLSASCNIDLGNKGRMTAAASSKQPASPSLPGRGAFQATWEILDMGILQPVLPDTVHIKGRLSGEARGNLLPGSRFDLTGKTVMSEGSFSWLGDQGEITAPVREAAIRWKWKDASLDGSINLALAQYGHAGASFRVPLAARLPLRLDGNSPATISAKGAMHEKGLLAALFPGLARETTGNVDFDLTAGGTFKNPRLDGKLSLKGAGAYLPPAGIHLRDVSAEILFNNDRITVTSFLVRSGPGYISGKAAASHEAGKIRDFTGTLGGESFQVVDLPGLQASISPDLSFAGSSEKASVRGSVLIPEALIREEKKGTQIKPSPDVVIVGREEKPKKALPFALDVAITVVLGDKILVKAYGIDTGLAGKVDITMKDPADIRASGGISTVKGKFDAYGVKLDVRRGRITFGGGPVDQANLNILALRKIDDVSAGVLVTGTPSSPLINLYSDPAMPDMDILSYIVLGRPRGASGQTDTALLARAAGALLTSGKSSAIQKQLGLDVIDVESTDGATSQSIVRIGKYLSPKLYVSYGRSIYTGENLFGIRYGLSRRVDVESTMGNESSAVIYYKVSFD